MPNRFIRAQPPKPYKHISLFRGFDLQVANARGLYLIICREKSNVLPPIAGTTTKGAGFGSALEEVESARQEGNGARRAPRQTR